jgi:integrase
MLRPTRRLSAVAVRNAKPGLHPDGGNLYLQVADSGAKSWLFRFGRGGRERWMGLGALHTISLAEAREDATRCRALLRDGIDPIEAKRARRAQNALAQQSGVTFADCAARLISSHESGWRNAKHRTQWIQTLSTYAYPTLGSLPVAAIDTPLVLRVLEPIWSTKPETASRLRGRIEAVIDWAKARGIRDGENPARWKGHLDHLLPAKSKVRKVKHFAALPYVDVGKFLSQLREREGISARALEFMILTAARTGEVTGARWSEIDLAAKVWTVPANRTKAEREHRVPLSPPAIAVLEAVRPRKAADDDLVFPGAHGRPLVDTAMRALHRRMGYRITSHGFRSSFRDWAAERTSYPNHVVEMALAHAIGDAVEAAYRRGDLFEKRRRLMDEWGRFCATAKVGNKVVPIGKAVK